MIEKIIEHFGLEKHPEGGYFREVYRSENFIENESLPENIVGRRSYATSIYFMLTSDEVSKLHRIKSDETWHFYGGDPLVVLEIDEDGNVHRTVLGNDFLNGQQLQYTVRANRWFGAYLEDGGEYALVGCTVAPGFDFRDFEMAQITHLSEDFPEIEFDEKIVNELI